MSDPALQLALLAAHLRTRRAAIVDAWRRLAISDPELSTGATLSRSQLIDHIPLLLETYEQQLDLQPVGSGAALEEKGGAVAHGLHRWQQGYDLQEVARELGLLGECVVAELEDYADAHPQLERGVLSSARKLWAKVSSAELGSSIGEYFRLQQLEAEGCITDLQRAVDELRELNKLSAALIHEAAHDLRGNMSVVLTATAALHKTEVAEATHYNFLRILDRNVMSLQHLLDDVLDIARIQAGKDRPHIVPVNAAQLLRELCEDMQHLADVRGLTLIVSGPAPFLVEGDAVKIRRIAQNLILNALKYTVAGGVKVSWQYGAADDGLRWVIVVQDTGPGIGGGSVAQLTGVLEQATDLGQSFTAEGAAGLASMQAPPKTHGQRRSSFEAGEGIGLAIVKRLADLLHASVEVHTEPNVGTTFRVLLPRRYPK